ncbi:hypothetical protein P8C59_009136 [Phyllachora maydis]|uniref:RAVE subunit 2/Rogdi n=1 Tax=Phyllachora maydis TaxID=1825666 RepID=A0AAD9MHY0_9PEZI|nr:hypothetical protein P8C59_009136 [Phyllachora maydis]
MSIDIWPPIPPNQLQSRLEEVQKRELDWLLQELHETLANLKVGLEECYALLAPLDPGSTLVLSTPRNEVVKGHVTRVGTRIVKGAISLRLRTLPLQTITINPEHPIHLAPLSSLHSLLTYSIDLLNLTVSYFYPSVDTPSAPLPSSDPPVSSPHFLAAQLRLLAGALSESAALLKGPPLPGDPAWTSRSLAPSHFVPALPLHPSTSTFESGPTSSSSSSNSKSNSNSNNNNINNNNNNSNSNSHSSSSSSRNHLPVLSVYLGIQESSLVLWLRALEPADAPVHFGTKLALAIGTARRLEHDEAERVFGFCCVDEPTMPTPPPKPSPSEPPPSSSSDPAKPPPPPPPKSTPSGDRLRTPRASAGPGETDVYVREKVRVESADPSLLVLAAKLAALGHTLGLARRNLAAVMGEDVGAEEED